MEIITTSDGATGNLTDEAKPDCAPRTCSVAAMNNTDVIITSTMLTIEQRNNPDNQMTAVLTKEQAARIIKALSEWHKIEPPNE